MFWSRLREDFPLAIVTLVGACAMLGILPFAIYRFVTGDPVAGFVDSAILLSIVVGVLYAWRTGETRGASWFTSVTTSIGCIVIAALLGLPGLFWAYAIVLSNFLLLRPREALGLTVAVVAVLTIHGKAFESALQMAMFAVSLSAVALFAFIFAYRTEQQRQQLQALAIRDPLTGAANRRSMEEELQLAIETSLRERKPYGLAILDLDHFKRINDRFGHAAGDKVLIEFVRVLDASTRKIDRLFRYGGEEFVLLFPNADPEALRTILESLRVRIGDSLHCRGETITVSIGAAALRPDEEWEAWLARADAALYQAKHAGRNRSVVSPEPESRVAAYKFDATAPESGQ